METSHARHHILCATDAVDGLYAVVWVLNKEPMIPRAHNTLKAPPGPQTHGDHNTSEIEEK